MFNGNISTPEHQEYTPKTETAELNSKVKQLTFCCDIRSQYIKASPLRAHLDET